MVTMNVMGGFQSNFTPKNHLPPRQLTSGFSRRFPSQLHLRPLQYISDHTRYRPITAAAALPGTMQQLAGLAGHAATQTLVLLTSSIAAIKSVCCLASSSIDHTVFGATANASFKLFLICAVVGWLLQTNRIPNSTANVLSKVSFELLIPCMLLSKVSSALAAQPDLSLLLGMLAVTLTQVAVGTAWGLLLSPLVDGSYSRNFQIFGWHPLNPPKAVESIASATALAVGVPHMAPALLPKPPTAPPGFRQLVAVSCAFGNSFTLPAVFFLTLLPHTLMDRALAYAALFLLGWSPAMWSVGLALIDSTPDPEEAPKQKNGQWGAMQSQQQQQQSWQASFPPGSSGSSSGTEGSSNPAILMESSSPGGSYAYSFDEDDHTDPADKYNPGSNPKTKPNSNKPGGFKDALRHVVAHPFISSFRQFLGRAINPPVWGILAGLTLGLTSLGRYLLAAAASPAGGVQGLVAPHLPPELMLAQSGLRSALEVVELMSSGTLAMQTLVLASSLLQRPEPVAGAINPTTTSLNSRSSALASAGSGTGGIGAALSGGKKVGKLRGVVGAVIRALSPVDAIEARALGILSLVRFLLLPLSMLGLMHWAGRFNLLGPLAADPLFLFVVAVESVMPSAQNLIILLQLSEKTRASAPAYARMLLKLYAYAILPVTLWVTWFATRLSIFALAG